MLPMEQLKGWSGRTGTRAVTWANQVGSCDLEWLGLTKPACNETHLPWIMWPACRTVVVKWQQRGRRATTLVFQQKFYGKNGFCHKSFAQIPEHYLGVTSMMVSLLIPRWQPWPSSYSWKIPPPISWLATGGRAWGNGLTTLFTDCCEDKMAERRNPYATMSSFKEQQDENERNILSKQHCPMTATSAALCKPLQKPCMY